MKSHKSRTRYYVIFLYDGKYEYRPAEDIFDANQEADYFARQPGILVLGIYDPQDWRFDWHVSGEIQNQHSNQVIDLTEKLRQSYENRLR